MSGAAHTRAQLACDVHGVVLRVSAGDPAVLEAVAQRLRAFPAAGGDGGESDVRIEFLAGDEAQLPALSGRGRPIYDTPYGELWYFNAQDVVYGELAGVRLHCASATGRVRIQAPAFRGRALYLATHPLLTIALMETLERRERFSLHAACLERDGGGVLLAGPSGAGKSTLTFALAGAGLSLLSDDVVFLDPRRAEVRALGFADALGITAAGARLFPQLRGALDAAPEDGFPKRLVRLEDILPEATLSQSCAPRVLVFPSVDPDSLSALTPLDPGEAMLRLVPDVLLTEPRATQSHLAALAALLGQVRTYTLRSGADLQRAAELVAGALAA